jgi:hypothetical protein
MGHYINLSILHTQLLRKTIITYITKQQRTSGQNCINSRIC